MALVERIKILASENGTNIRNLEQLAGIGNGTIRRWDDSPPSSDKLYKIANLLNTSMEYLIQGDEEAGGLGISKEDREILRLFHRLPRDARIEFKGEIKGYLKALEAEENDPLDGTTAK